jgi:hypothetical protein
MAWRPTSWVVEGELDNTTQGWTIGWIRLEGRKEPLTLKLLGNCHPDLAGWKFRIVRTEPCPDQEGEPDFSGIATDQSGMIGDITAGWSYTIASIITRAASAKMCAVPPALAYHSQWSLRLLLQSFMDCL